MSGSDEPAGRPGERSFRALVEHSLDVLMLTDAEARLLYVSPSVTRVLGYTPAELLGKSGFVFTHPDDLQDDLANLARVLATPDERLRFEYRGRHKDGSFRDMELVVQNLLDDPEVGALVMNARDVTEQRRAQQKLREHDHRFRLLAENALDVIAIYELEPVRRIAFISPSVERVTGYPVQTFYDDPLLHDRLIHPEDTALLEQLKLRPADELSRPITLRWIRSDGAVVWVELMMSPVLSPDGRLISINTISRDVTEKVQLEAQLHRAQKMEALGRLAGGIAHDFNNLLGAALLTTDRLSRKAPDDSPLAAGLGQIREAIDRGVSLTRQLLTFSRRDPEPPRPVDLNQAIARLQSFLGRVLPETFAIEVRTLASPARILIGPGQLDQLILNLVLNARDAMPDGGIIEIGTNNPGDGAVELTVADSGVGMHEVQRRRVMDPFFTTKQVGSGTGVGLGLAVVYGIVEQSQGSVELDSAPGAGTTARVRWPLAPAEAEAERPSVAPPVTGRGETILLVEDEATLLRLTSDILAAHNYQVLAASDSSEARRLVQRHPEGIDLLLSDVVMPGGDGRALATELRSQQPAMAVVFTSGYPDEYSPSGDARFLPKPFSEDQLVRIVRQALDARQPPDQPPASGASR
jgi:two-component system, cell cycle sensor histidine kinase and response regulator CckA